MIRCISLLKQERLPMTHWPITFSFLFDFVENVDIFCECDGFFCALFKIEQYDGVNTGMAILVDMILVGNSVQKKFPLRIAVLLTIPYVLSSGLAEGCSVSGIDIHKTG